MKLDKLKVGIVGLGYVGLPLAIEFGKKYETIGFDIDSHRIDELRSGFDSTLECGESELSLVNKLYYTSKLEGIKDCNFYIVTVPTPIDRNKQPDLKPLIHASEDLGNVISKGDIIVYESTVYPGATEEICIPIVEKSSGLTFNKDFFVGYSPERINPGDKLHRVSDILKVTSGSNEEVAEYIDNVYSSIIKAGTYKASSIKVAEASKVIENVQRDVNIALVNELFQIFSKMGIDTKEVIDAASTKWNFMKLMPGLVGGHCISVDPYYLLHKSNSLGYIPDLIRTARVINDGMPDFIASNFLKELIKNNINPVKAKVLILGFSFKENCPDLRNTKTYDLYLALKNLNFEVTVFDPCVDVLHSFREYGIKVESCVDNLKLNYDGAILAVAHDSILDLISNNKVKFNYLMDFKGVLKKDNYNNHVSISFV